MKPSPNFAAMAFESADATLRWRYSPNGVCFLESWSSAGCWLSPPWEVSMWFALNRHDLNRTPGFGGGVREGHDELYLLLPLCPRAWSRKKGTCIMRTGAPMKVAHCPSFLLQNLGRNWLEVVFFWVFGTENRLRHWTNPPFIDDFPLRHDGYFTLFHKVGPPEGNCWNDVHVAKLAPSNLTRYAKILKATTTGASTFWFRKKIMINYGLWTLCTQPISRTDPH